MPSSTERKMDGCWIKGTLLGSVLLLAVMKSCSGDLEAVLQRCCQTGETLARNHTNCSPPSSALDPDMAQNRRACLTSVYICCVRAHRQKVCIRGREAAKEGGPCQSTDPTFSDCCTGCSLGLEAGLTRSPCSFSQFSFGASWDQAYIDCCEEMSLGPGTAPFTSSRGICEPNNPCTQKCDVIENQPKCSCYDGFKLSADQASCDDINECYYGNHTCNPVSESCLNTVGGFKCSPKPIVDPGRPDSCSIGFRFNPDTQRCEDIDECLENVCTTDMLCANTIGSFDCFCPRGFVVSQSTGYCIDVDECGQGTDRCDRTKELCQNSHGSYQCIPGLHTRSSDCPAGFKWDGTRCLDVNECLEYHTCNPATQHCVNNVGSYKCVTKATCPGGLRWVGNKCEDINECLENLNDCDQRYQNCVNTYGSFQCQSKTQQTTPRCGPGFTYDTGLRVCRDIDECLTLKPCSENQVCDNTEGSYRCECPLGYDLDSYSNQCKDINECQLGNHVCSESSQRCDNTPGSYRCVRFTSCGTGYTLNAATNQCEDDDECLLNTHNCGPGFICRNLFGTFRCDRITCPAGQKLLADGTCKIVVCGQGFQADDAGNCLDVNECAIPNVCRRNQHCVNSVGSFRCQNLINCPEGFELNELGNNCEDVDECALGTFNCGSQQTCRNRPGGYLCECPSGYVVNQQFQCEDIDECARFPGQVCSSVSECINTQGSYTCRCKDGYRKSEDDKSCLDIDECTESANICQHTCNNVWGSYQCSCRPGFTLAPDKRSCEDIDECQAYAKHGELCIGFCVNEPGSFSCSCPPGYRLASDKRTCQDIDECLEQNVCRGSDDVCLNTRGGYKCNRISCPPNYVRDKDHKNRCKKARHCNYDDPSCLEEPMSISTNYITFVSNMAIPFSGQLDIFTMRGPKQVTTTSQFNLRLVEARALEAGVPPATRSFFNLRQTAHNEVIVSVIRSLQGPQEVELELELKMFHSGKYGGHAVAKIFLSVTKYKF